MMLRKARDKHHNAREQCFNIMEKRPQASMKRISNLSTKKKHIVEKNHEEKSHCIKECPRMNATTNKNKGDDLRHSISFD